MILKLYNTETREKQVVIPADGKTIKMYTCGPTVYNFAHIGNFRTYVFEDILRRTLKFFGFQVMQAMNLTDIDDKTLKGAIEHKISLDAFTKPFKIAFFEDLKTLNIEKVEFYPEATAYIPEMIKIIQTLLDNGTAYRGEEGSVYFAIRKFPRYGRLSHLTIDELKAGASGVCVDEYGKDNLADFVLWKSYDPERDGEIYWDSPLGRGRPGWHIECSAMAMKLLGDTLDIHVGGVDNMFPHHENEIAQSEACSGHTFARLWMHSEHLLVDHKKMSKSLGNFYTLRDLLQKGYTGRQVRFMLLQGHYRMQLNFTFQALDAAASSLQRLDDFVYRLKEIATGSSSGKVAPLLKKADESFRDALADDLNMAAALAALFDLVREINALSDAQYISPKEAQEVLAWLHSIDAVLGVLFFHEEEAIPADLQDALRKRIEARAAKNWKEADHWRDYIHQKGYLIEDTPTGGRLKKQKGTL